MEPETILKNGASPKSLMSKRNFFTRRFLCPLVFTLLFLCTVDGLFAQRFDCKRDKLDETAIRFSPDPSSLTLGQPCEISIYNRAGKKVSGSDFSITSNNINVMSRDLTFHIDQKVKGDPWLHLNGELIEEDVKITVAHKTCIHTYDYSFHIKQNYLFDNVLNCQGEIKEFAVAKYNNGLNKNLFVVADVKQKSIYLLEGPLTIDGSGVNGKDGAPGTPGANGKSNAVLGAILSSTMDGGDGGDGANGGDGGNGGNGGDITVYAPKNIMQQISVNVNAGRGGLGGPGGKGGQGAQGSGRGRNGRNGRDGQYGQNGFNGERGRFSIQENNEIKQYFENINHPYFKIDNIVND